MADYFTLEKIAARIGYKTAWAVYSQIEKKGFPAFKRYHNGLHRKNQTWYTNDDLIRQWELVQCELSRGELLKRRARSQVANKSSGDCK